MYSTHLKLIVLATLAIGASTTASRSIAQGTQSVRPGAFEYTTAGKMSTYRNLAQYAYEAYLNRDDQTAAILGGIIESSWDKGETSLEKASPGVYAKIDVTMDNFVKPLKYYKKAGRPDTEKEKAALEAYLAALTTAN